jgi:hypothetical protein
MEGLKKRAIVFGSILLVAGAMTQVFAGNKVGNGKTEAWLEKTAPSTMPGYFMVTSPDNPSVSYRMDQVTYDTLRPYGIVARVFQGKEESVDVVIIASQAKNSFHDPRNCFTSQQWNIISEREVAVPTKTRGNVKVTAVELSGPTGKTTAAYVYKGPGGFASSTMGLKVDMLKHQLLTSKMSDGVFYRFISGNQTTTDELLAFVGKYLDEANRQTDGYL